MFQWIKRGVRRVLRALFNWASLLAIPCGLVVGYTGHRTLGALLILGGTLAYFTSGFGSMKSRIRFTRSWYEAVKARSVRTVEP